MHTGQNIKRVRIKRVLDVLDCSQVELQLKRVLDTLECSQVDLLRETEGVSESQFSNYLAGRRLPSVAQRDAIARGVERIFRSRLDAAVAADERARRQ